MHRDAAALPLTGAGAQTFVPDASEPPPVPAMITRISTNRTAVSVLLVALGACLLAGGAFALTVAPAADAPAASGALVVGDNETFSLDRESFATTCVQVGSHCAIFLEEGVSVDPALIEDLRREFDEVIHPLETETFGTEPDIDGDERVHIVIVSGPGGWAGVFDPLGLLAINKKDVFYLDITSAYRPGFAATAAHEFQHLIHCRHDFDEGYMVDEGCAIYAELLLANFSTGNLPEFQAYRNHPESSLHWTPEEYAEGRFSGAHYGASGLWILYLSEKYGDLSGDPDHAHFIRDLVEEDENGFAGVDAVLARHGYGDRSEDVFKTWVVANYLDDTGIDPHYGYESIDFDAPMHTEASVDLEDLALTDNSYAFPATTLPAWSAAYYTVRTEDPANLSFSCAEGCWWQRIDEGKDAVTVVASPLNASGDVALVVHADRPRTTAREKHPASA